MRYLFILLFFVSPTFICKGQEKYKILPENADCSSLIDLLPKDTIYGPTSAPSGPGAVVEISGDKTSPTAFETEHNTVWYRFRMPDDCVLTFDIIPVSTKDDYDFILYKYSGKNFCNDVLSKTLKPVRAYISRNDPSIGSRTGLAAGATDEFVHSGPGKSYCKPLNAKKGELYVLVLDNVYPGGSGHTLRLHFHISRATAQQNQNNNPNPVQVPERSSLSVTIVDKETHELVKATARLYIKQRKLGTPISTFDSVTSFNTGLDANSNFILKIETPGYFDYSKEIKTVLQAENMVIQAELDKIIVGKNVVFDNILFYGNEARFLPEASPVLESLASTLKKNPRMKIKIEGHVNCPTTWEDCATQRMQDFNRNLSINRAKAVYEYLMEEGIDPLRLSYEGYGATRMLYPDARSEEKMKLNRRVEIVIVSN